ncbi:MAG: type II toxin-antitoxin system RelE/ParE family toxin [Bacteroidales bacterium]|nr:type II toxin-antitoxin system RelE/ParE family toxin [Bacteroidales bacterium]
MDGKRNFEILILKPAQDFLNSLDKNIKRKIDINMANAQKENDTRLFKKLSGSDIWEFRTKFQSMEYRLLAFWDKTQNKLVVVSNGFVKKSQKTPEKEIKKAEQIMKLYYKQK